MPAQVHKPRSPTRPRQPHEQRSPQHSPQHSPQRSPQHSPERHSPQAQSPPHTMQPLPQYSPQRHPPHHAAPPGGSHPQQHHSPVPHQGAPLGPPPMHFVNKGPPPMVNAPPIPPGFEALFGTDRIVVKQEVELLEVFFGIETNNRYQIFNGFGMPIMYAYEDTPPSLMCYGEDRPFTIRMINSMSNQVMFVQSDVDCCSRQVVVQVPPGNFVSLIKEDPGIFASNFYVHNAAGEVVFKVFCPIEASMSNVGNVTFDILAKDEVTKVGQITKQWGGFLKEAFTDADTFGLMLPPDMDVMWKAVLIAVTFVVDFEFYEKDARKS